MTYQVLCTFDLKAASSADYKNAYSDLEKIGLSRVQVGSKREVVIPTTTVLGDFNGQSADSVRDYIREKVIAAFTARGFQSEIFIAVGKDGTWGSGTTH